jgi:hypothetical protein
LPAELVPWAEHLASWTWRQGEHVTLVGPTGMGKTYLAGEVLPRRRFVLILACKAKDPTLSAYARRQRFKVIRSWGELPNSIEGTPYERVILWPRAAGGAELRARQRVEFAGALEDVYRMGGWTVYVDELSYLVRKLKLSEPLETLWLQGRSLGISVVAGTQRPAWVPLEAYDQASHLYLWRDPDAGNRRRLSEIGGAVDSKALGAEMLALEGHEVLYVDGRTGRTVRTTVERGKA